MEYVLAKPAGGYCINLVKESFSGYRANLDRARDGRCHLAAK